MDKYAKDDKLYAKDLQLRAKCNQCLFFDAAILSTSNRDFVRTDYQELPQDKINGIYDAYDIFEALSASDPFLVGANLTIADVSSAITVAHLDVYVPLNSEKYPKILAEMNQTIPFFEEMNARYVALNRQMIKKKLNKDKQVNFNFYISVFGSGWIS